MVSPRHRVALVVSAVLLLALDWILIFFAPAAIHLAPDSPLTSSVPITFGTIAVVLLFTSGWQAKAEARSRAEAGDSELEVIPIERWRPPGLKPRKDSGPVVVLRKSHIRPVKRHPFIHQKRRALGLPARPPFGRNRRRSTGWPRRFAG